MAAPLTRFVYLGPEATFAEQALRTIPEAEAGVRTPVRSVPEALDSVRSGEADAALIPMENSIGGQIGVSLDELVSGSPLSIAREVVLPVQFVLVGSQECDLGTVRRVAAHPQASAQCRGWLRAHLPGADVVDVLSNGAAAAAVAAGEFEAAVCAPIGAVRYALPVLARDIADHPDGMTRFVLVRRPTRPPEPTGSDVTTLAVLLEHDRVGALLAVLTELAVRGVNLTRIESRPTGERLGRYTFFLDCDGHVVEARLGEALRGLRRVCSKVWFLGSYPRAGASGGGRAVPPPGLTDADFAAAEDWLARLRAGEPC